MRMKHLAASAAALSLLTASVPAVSQVPPRESAVLTDESDLRDRRSAILWGVIGVAVLIVLILVLDDDDDDVESP